LATLSSPTSRPSIAYFDLQAKQKKIGLSGVQAFQTTPFMQQRIVPENFAF
jgi:hypothetical protein